MKDMNLNLFKHSPKELTTDAFITWLLYFVDSHENYKEEKRILFNELLLKSEDIDKKVSDISIKRQDKNQNGRSDIILYFKLDGHSKKILFENKTWSTTTKKQLKGYKERNQIFYKYIYLKLAYINYNEKRLTKECGYDVIDVEMLSNTLGKIKSIHQFVSHYLEFINVTFLDLMRKLNNDFISINIEELLDNLQLQQYQQYLMSRFCEKLEGKLDVLLLRVGSSFGIPWTQLDISKETKIYGEGNELIFWRMDNRSGKNYIRLNQYSNISKELKNKKIERLEKLRKIANKLLENYPFNTGKVINKGVKESEILIFFLDENNIEELIEKLPQFSIEFDAKYKNFCSVSSARSVTTANRDNFLTN